MKKIAIATENNAVAGHFGHCAGFTLVDIENTQIVSQKFVDNPGHKSGFLPEFLSEQGAEVIIAGGMGRGAIDLFASKSIETITGAQGNINEIIAAYISGNLHSTGSICNEHQHAGNCGNH